MVDRNRDINASGTGRSWWPALIGVGLAAVAVVGVLVIRSGDADAPTLTPATEPTSSSTPTPATSVEPTTTSTSEPGTSGASVLVEDGCITVTLTSTDVDGSATGCPQHSAELDHLGQRTFVANLDGPVLITSASADPTVDVTATVDTGDFATRCRWDDLAPRIPAGGLVELVVCNDSGVMGAATAASGRVPSTYPYFTLPTPYLPDGGDLGSGAPVPGLAGALAFTAPVQDIVTCSLLLLPDRSGWAETCGEVHGLGVATALVQVDAPESTVYELAVDDTGLITSARALDAMAPSSGCSIDAASELIRAVDETQPSSIVMGIGCIGDKAALTTGSVLSQTGAPDGAIWLAVREDGVWNITDSGTSVETLLSFPIVPFDVWSTWPESTQPGFRSYWWEPIMVLPTQPTVEAFTDELLATLGTLGTDPEFPVNERVVAVEPGGLPLIVAQVDLGGDDSVAGAVIYVWFGEEFDDSGLVGWRPTAILTGDVCARGGSAGREICI